MQSFNNGLTGTCKLTPTVSDGVLCRRLNSR